jgi:hypothetical protein
MYFAGLLSSLAAIQFVWFVRFVWEIVLSVGLVRPARSAQ